MKKYIAYRYYSGIFYSSYERKELTEEELTKYIEKHKEELENIEIFELKNKIKI